MSHITYDGIEPAPRDKLAAAQNTAWAQIGSPGAFLTAAERIAVAAETRAVKDCGLCRQRKDALSPEMVNGDHDGPGGLSAAETDMVHRIASDPGRLSEAWVEKLRAAGLGDERYIEILSVIAMTVMVDRFRAGVGLDPAPLPDPGAGAPSSYKAPNAARHDHWVAFVEPGDEVPEDGGLYPPAGGPPMMPPVVKALTGVPAAYREYWALADQHYLPLPELGKFDTDLRALNRLQIEVIAARVSAVHQCVY